MPVFPVSRGLAGRGPILWGLTLCLTLLFLCSLPAASASASEVALPDYLVSGWDALSGKLLDALALRDKQETLPDSAFFGPDKASNSKKINGLLDQALDILTKGKANDFRRRALDLRTEIPALRLEADSLRNQRIGAPESSRLPWVKTRQKIEERLKELDGEIADKERALAELNGSVASSLKDMGLELSEKQVDVLLSSVTGDDLMENAVVFANVRFVVEKLAELSRGDRDSLELSRRYSGMYLILNDILIYTQEQLVRKLDDQYKPRLLTIQKEAETLRREALGRASQASYTQQQRDSFARNAESNSLTMQVAGLYMDLLNSQRKSLVENLVGLKKNRDLAENTYRTVRSSGDLRTLIRSGLELFDTVHALSMPDLQPFENDAIRKEFDEINKRMKGF
ncbi:MAG: hypothetical protein GX256_02795 [Fretibacterium sp.]|nr:hypothetical protein [Fretibacterium sp.]